MFVGTYVYGHLKLQANTGHVCICLYPTTTHVEAEVGKNEPAMMGHGALFQSSVNDVRQSSLQSYQSTNSKAITPKLLKAMVGQAAIERCAFIAKRKVRANRKLQAR